VVPLVSAAVLALNFQGGLLTLVRFIPHAAPLLRARPAAFTHGPGLLPRGS
jgi:hypothetical protein